jgi:hypothetical protein
MKIKLVEDPLFCPACDRRMTGFALLDLQCNSCVMPCYLVTGDTKRAGEQMRLRRSWAAVLVGSGPSELAQGTRGESMVSPRKDILVDGIRPPPDAKRSLLLEPQPVVRRSLHTPCPRCGSRTVRSRDGRDMCLICGYLQSHT